MRASAAMALCICLFAGAASAQEQTDPAEETSSTPAKRADYSRPTLMRLLAEERPEDRPRIRYRVGSVEFNALNTRWRFAYLPIMAPLSGTRLGATREWPDPFSLTGTPIATPPRLWRDRRAIQKELKRIGRTSATIKVDAKPEQ
jgi:hypothetical protein